MDTVGRPPLTYSQQSAGASAEANTGQMKNKSRKFILLLSKHFCLLHFSKNLNIKIYKTIILPVVLYGSETWSLTLSEECRLRVFENRIMKRIFGPKRDKNKE